MNLHLQIAVGLVCTLALAVPASFALADEKALDAIHQKIVKRYARVQHITSDALTQKLSDPDEARDIVLIDVREADEYGVSHLGNAYQIDPGIWTSTFMKAFKDRTRGKTVVFYCSVGRRSSYAASYLQDALKKNGARSVLNLKGGIFSWHNQSRPLYRSGRATDFVHPYSKYWGSMIERRQLTRYKPPTNETASTPTPQ